MINPTKLASIAFLTCVFVFPGHGQQAVTSPTPDLTGVVPDLNDPRVRRELALAKLLEGQRHIWKTSRYQTQAGKTNQMLLAKPAFLKAIELDPTLAEGYTALAEIAVATPPGDLEAAIELATKAVQANPQNFGAHRLLARFYTIKSRLNNGRLDDSFSEKAIAEWKEVARLDPRNAEAWAFISAFAEARNQPDENIRALRGWVSSVPPLEDGFYERRMGGASLSPESASIKLAAALARSGKSGEAVSILGELIADDPRNTEAISMLSEVVESADPASAEKAISSLQQAVYANPGNVSLVDMLARMQGRVGRLDEGVNLLKKSISELKKTDKAAASTLSVSLAELFLEKDRYDESIGALENALTIRGVADASTAGGEDREFVVYVFEKLIHVSKLAGRADAAKASIERARKILGKDDLFSDRQMVMLLDVSGNKKEALALVRSLRERSPTDATFLRQEASILTDLGQVQAAVDLVRKKGQNTTAGGSVPQTDEFSDLLFISNLYLRANLGSDAIAAANQALTAATGSERKQIAMTALATAQQMSGDFAAAERTLRDVLKVTPSNPIALNNLGYFLAERGERLEEAAEMIGQALKIDPRNPSYLDSLGWVYFKLGKLSEAEKSLTDAARIDADSSTIREHLGDVYKQKGDQAKARSYWEKALRLASEDPEIERLKKKLGRN